MNANSLRPRRRARRSLKIGGIVLVALVAGVAACEVAGWPFLVSPVEKFLAKTLKRDVRLQDVAGMASDSAPAGVDAARNAASSVADKLQHGDGGRASIRFFGGLKVKAPHVFIGAPAWSQEPFFLDARDASLTLAYAALWRASRGGPLDLKRLEAKTLIVHAERRADGSASWEFGDKPAAEKTAEPTRLPIIRQLVIADGLATYKDEILKADITTKLSTNEGTEVRTVTDNKQLANGVGLHANATGTYLNLPLKAELHAPGALAFMAKGAEAPPIPVVFDIRAAKSQVAFTGTVRDLTHFGGLIGVFRANGPSLAEVGKPLGVTLPSTGAFKLSGRLAKNGDIWNVVTDTAVVGDSRLAAALTYDAGATVPLLSGRVSATQFLLKDLLPSVGVPPEVVASTAPADKKSKPEAKSANARVLPDTAFDLPSLRVMNANVLFDFDRAELGSAFDVPLKPLKAHLTLRDGKLLIDDIDARTAEGNVGGLIALDGTGDVALWRTRLHWDGVRLERWLKQERKGDAPPYIAGRIAGRAELRGKGRSTSEILASLDGSAMTYLRDGKVSHLVVEGAGIDIAQALGMLIKGDDALPMTCAVVDLAANKGVLSTRAFVVDTRDSTIVVDGTLSMATEGLDLRAVVSPKDFSPLALRSPIHVKGSFGDPKISIEKTPALARAGAAVALAFVTPLAALIPLIDTGDGDDKTVGCSALLSRAKNSAVAAAKK